MQNIDLRKRGFFLNLIYLPLYIQLLFKIAKQHPDLLIMQSFEYQLGMAMNTNEEMPADNADAVASYLDGGPHDT